MHQTVRASGGGKDLRFTVVFVASFSYLMSSGRTTLTGMTLYYPSCFLSG